MFFSWKKVVGTIATVSALSIVINPLSLFVVLPLTAWSLLLCSDIKIDAHLVPHGVEFEQVGESLGESINSWLCTNHIQAPSLQQTPVIASLLGDYSAKDTPVAGG